MKRSLSILLFLAAPATAQTGAPLPAIEAAPAPQPAVAPEPPLPGTEPIPPQPSPAPFAPAPVGPAESMPPLPPQYRDPRLQDIPYDPNAVVQLFVAPGKQMTVMFASGEKIQSVAVGDSASWQVTASRAGDSLFVKPTTAYGTTNMTVISDTRIYLFDLVSTASPDSAYLIRFTYPETAAAVAEQQAPAEEEEEGRYRLSGARALRPDAIEDDARKTYITWRAGKAMPAVFAIGPGGDEMLVDGYVRDGVYTIDRVYKTLIFRFDKKTATAVRRK